MYMRYLQILAKCCNQVFQEMAKTEVLATQIKKDERLLCDFAVAQVVEYQHLDNALEGYFMLGFNNKTMAIMVASSISEHLGLPPVTTMDADAQDILGEFLNTFVGQTISEWDKLGLPVRFGTPRMLCEENIEFYNTTPSEPYLIILTLTVSHVVIRVTFVEKSKQEIHIPRVLIVDDSALIRRLLKKAFDDIGFQTDEAVDGQEAVQKFKNFKPDLTIMDLIMPRMGGLDAIMEIRETNPNAKFVILTSTARKDEIVTAKTLGITHYVVKPVTNMVSFRETIRKILE